MAIKCAVALLGLALVAPACARELLQNSTSAVCYVSAEQSLCVLVFVGLGQSRCQDATVQLLSDASGNCYVALPYSCVRTTAAYFPGGTSVGVCGSDLTDVVTANLGTLEENAGWHPSGLILGWLVRECCSSCSGTFSLRALLASSRDCERL